VELLDGHARTKIHAWLTLLFLLDPN